MTKQDTRPNVPETVKRVLRTQAGYGCCICGLPIVQYHHIIPYHVEKHFRPEDMMCLCPNHHDEANNVMPVDEQRKWKLNPVNILKNRVNGLLRVNQSGCDIILGGHTLSSGQGSIVKIDGQQILGVRLTTNGALLLSLKIFDSDNNLIAEIIDNEWFSYVDLAWDLIFSYKKLKIRNAPRDIAIYIDTSKEPISIYGKLWKNKLLMLLDKKGIHIGEAHFIGNGKIINGVMDLSSESGGIKIIGNPNNYYIEPSMKIGRNEKCWCGSGKKYKRCHFGVIS